MHIYYTLEKQCYSSSVLEIDIISLIFTERYKLQYTRIFTWPAYTHKSFKKFQASCKTRWMLLKLCQCLVWLVTTLLGMLCLAYFFPWQCAGFLPLLWYADNRNLETGKPRSASCYKVLNKHWSIQKFHDWTTPSPIMFTRFSTDLSLFPKLKEYPERDKFITHG